MTSTRTHPFDLATGLTALGDGRFTGRTTAPYANMVGPFGGITAATMLRAIMEDPRHLAQPVTLTVNFAGPISDGPFEIEARPMRTNRNTQHWSLTMTQDDEVTTTATAIFANRRPTWSLTEAVPPPAPPVAAVEPSPVPDFIAWVDNYEMRFVEGGIAEIGQGRGTSTSTLWVRDEPARPLDYPALTALSDVFFPRVMHRLSRVIPAGTVSMTVYFHATPDQLAAQADRYILATARAQHFGTGFFDQTAELWNHDRDLLVTSHQIVYYKDTPA
ncbi:acyl-CoA thioesterase [Nocardia mexicana]|uniref:Thioesterase superfamily protein n=1 Tax=Nocardia mexicana TaxID=279262 RepID=A0A370GMJ4_9NOCA|nr:thioesterase family protein [Nocardia mexicana]RDI44496.1 thioesterase superfamily protein [Nocardia mexicana]